MLYAKNLEEMSLRFNRSTPNFRTIREKYGIGRRPRTRHDIRLGRNLPINFMIVRQKPDQTFIFRSLPAVDFMFSFTDIRFLKKDLQLTFMALNLIYVQ